MITITIEQLVNAANTGSLKRFFECELSLPAWKALRHTAAACDRELAVFEKKRQAMIAQHEGKPAASGLGLEFATKEQAEAFAADWSAIMACAISDLPGDPIKLDDIVSGKLTAADLARIAPFLAD